MPHLQRLCLVLAIIVVVCGSRVHSTQGAALRGHGQGGNAVEALPESVKSRCVSECKRLNGNDQSFYDGKMVTCGPFTNERPMPSVLHACSAGFSIKIIQAACILGCGDLRLLCNVESDRQVDRTIIASADIEQVSDKSCRKARINPPKPLMGNACQAGVRGATRVGCSIASKVLHGIQVDTLRDEAAANGTTLAAIRARDQARLNPALMFDT